MTRQSSAIFRDGSLSAQFGHTIGVTATGYEVFTALPQDGIG